MRVAVLGAYQTKFGELWDKSLEDLIAESAFKAISDASLKPSQIEAAYIGNKLSGHLSNQNHLSSLFAHILKTHIPIIRVEAACASGGMAVHQACLAIASGQYKRILVVGAEKMSDCSTEEVSSALMTAAGEDERNSGLSFVSLYALIARFYLDEYKADVKDLAYPAVKNHFHASLNPKAHLPFCVSLDQVLNSPLLADPLRFLHCSPMSDGAAALVLSTPKLAPRKKITITASCVATDSLSLNHRQQLSRLQATNLAGKKAYQMAGVSVRDIRLAEVHDCFSIAEILALEDLNFCARGEGHVLVRNGEIKLGGRLPVNVSGGLKACGHPVGATGVKQLVELYNQMKGRCGQRQVEKTTVSLAHNVGGTGGTAVVHIMQS
jgi:acetyl-CoA C-acetyltransferase